MQAGQIQGRILHSMGAAVRSNGLGALYSGHMAFLMQGLPYDVTELVTYSQLRAAKGPLRQMPTEMRDMLIGELPMRTRTTQELAYSNPDQHFSLPYHLA